jgi:hypothetical protein
MLTYLPYGAGVVTCSKGQWVTILYYSPIVNDGIRFDYPPTELSERGTWLRLMQPGEFLALPPKVRRWLMSRVEVPRWSVNWQ